MLIGIEASHANKDKRTGVEEYCFQIIEHFKKIIPSEHQVVLYSHEPLRAPLADLPSHWSVKVLPWKLKKGWSQFRLSWELLKNPPEVFFAPGQLVPFYAPPNTFTMIHDCAFRVYPRAYNFWGRQYLKLMDRLITWRSKIIITSTEFNKKEIIKFYNFPAERIKVIPLSYNSERYKKLEPNFNKSKILRAHNITKPFLLSVARLEEKKNTKRIAAAFDLIKKQVDCQLVLVGKPGAGYAEVEKAISASPYKDDIIRPGFLSNEDLVALYNSAQVFMFPSLYEGFGLPVLEAMACGIPVLAGSGTASQEVGKGIAIFADPFKVEEIAEMALKLLQNDTLRQEKILAGLEYVKQFSWDKTARETWEIIKG